MATTRTPPPVETAAAASAAVVSRNVEPKDRVEIDAAAAAGNPMERRPVVPAPAKASTIAPAVTGYHVVVVSADRFAALRDLGLSSGSAPIPIAQSVVLGSTFTPFPQQTAPPPKATASEVAQAEDAQPRIVPPLPAVAELTADVPVPRSRPSSFEPASEGRLQAARSTIDETSLAEPTIVPPLPSAGERIADVPLPPPRPPSLGGRTQVADLATTDATNAPESRIVPPLPSVAERVVDVPLPRPRPAFLLPPVREATPRLYGRRRIEQRTIVARTTPAEPDRRSFFERLFGMPQPSGPALAYAPPGDGGGLGSGLRSPRLASYDSRTAIYDISAHTVYLPDGTRLEAHSGLGSNIDDPRSLRTRMRGVTPPNLYELGARAELFHGVRAIRLNPTDPGAMYGRDGMLAHTYMLGPRGDSNGCVVFKDYRAFLQAFDSGAIKRLAVVSSLN